MKLTIAVYVEAGKGEQGKEFIVRPLFFATPVREHAKLERAMHHLAQDLRLHLTELGEKERHDELARWTFAPALETHRVHLHVELRKKVSRPRLFFVSFESCGRRVAFSPAVPDVWFEIGRGEKLKDRANEVLSAHFREQEKDLEESEFADPETLSLRGSAWVTPLELEIHPSPVAVVKERSAFAFLGDQDEMQGWQELRRVGRCLDELYPDDLDRVLLRDKEVDEITRLLRGNDRRPVLILGPALVGKTALVHEYVWRVADGRRGQQFRVQNNVWLLSPQRLISGMMYVGQWEKRLLAILAEAKKRDHVLYFDDLLGLYYAGQSGQSDLSVAHVLKPYVERREVRLVGELTPEAFRVLRERDRGFADLFQVLPVRPPTDEETLRILVAVTRQLEGQHSMRFRTPVLPTVLDLVRRYVRHQAFPGKAALFLRRLAVKHRKGQVARRTALIEFHEQTGLAFSMLDGLQKLERKDIVTALEKDVIGQPQALAVAADVISIAKARLNDPDRPLASLLFLGPTGVGKTQSARAIAKYLFGEADKMLRFDMNEYTSPGSAARLAGTFDQPEGLLTAAVRRQPFAVVLFDEIEKADAEVFDLLLQVLGEGRLTDALGRTVDFTSTLIILTSNLGVREAQQSLGFRAGDGHNVEAYVLAAEKFFRPEFFNRLDRILPFNRLSREDVGRIAQLLLHDLLGREGLVRRKCVLRVEPEALERIIDAGFDPVLGARALKRALERQLAQPVAVKLAAGMPETITVVSVYAKKPEAQAEGTARIAIDLRALAEVEPLPNTHRELGPTADVLREIGQVLRNIEDRYAHLRPRGEITASSIAGEHLFFFVLQEQVRQLRARGRELQDVLEQSRRSSKATPAFPVDAYSRGIGFVWRKFESEKPILGEIAAAADIRQYLEDVAQHAAKWDENERGKLVDLVERTALLHALADSGEKAAGEQVLVYVWTASPAGMTYVAQLAWVYQEGIVHVESTDEEQANWWQLEQTPIDLPVEEPARALVVSGLAAERMTSNERGTHLFCPEHAGLVPVQVHVWPIGDNVDPKTLLQEKLEARRQWLATTAPEGTDPLGLEPVVRIYNVGRHWLDLRTRLTGEGMFGLRKLLLATLPMARANGEE